MNRMQATVTHTAQFFEVDPMQVVWNGTYFDYFEYARGALLDGLGIGYDVLARMGYMLYVVRNEAKYIRPVKLHQTVAITATLTEWEYVVRLHFEVRDQASGALCAKGRSEQMYARISDGKAVIQVPDAVRAVLEEALS